jgi:hypothetical protein
MNSRSQEQLVPCKNRKIKLKGFDESSLLALTAGTRLRAPIKRGDT